ncbi:MAG: hypothetical protein ABSD73_03430 [Candidatus Bathyarchaeia archaeon]|jgi:hypothetical protein
MSILGVNPNTGNVGTLVAVTANVTTANGNYDVYFDQDLRASGTANASSVSATFIVPQTTAGDHNVTVIDVATHDNATATFTVTTSYSLVIPAMAKPLQENDSIPISINITGGESGKTYVANVTVQAPTNVSYVNMLNVGTSTLGNGTAIANYPSDFSAGANTSFVGNYAVSFNTTMGNQTFSVGLTNSTQYHRTQTVNIKAAYEPNENVNVTIAGNNIYNSVNLTDPSGLINYDWLVPANASIGNYTVNVFSLSGHTVKNPPDTQNFTVPGFAVNVTARNLAEEPVPNVNINALENGNVADNETTSATGLATLNLEVGNYTCEAYAQNENVGELKIEVNDTASLNLVCNLTDLNVQVVYVVNGTEIGIPDAGVSLNPGGYSVTTLINGTAIIRSLLPDLQYDLNVTRYGTLFNETSISQLLVNKTAVAWYNVTVSLPTLTLQVNATKSGGQPFNNTLVRVQELSGEPLFDTQYTDANGSATFNLPLGRYYVMVVDKSGITLNETTVDVFQNQSTLVQCDFYGLTLSVKVVDYFGQGIGNVNVKLLREGEPTMSAPSTQGDGTATFNNVIGGTLEVALYIGDSAQPIVTQGLTVQNSTTIQVRIDKYIVLGGLLVETSEFATVLVIVLAIVFILALEVYRFRRLKTEKSETESSNKES